MSISYISATTCNYVVATSITRSLPASINDNDGIFIVIFRREAWVTTPAGWTLKASAAGVGSGNTQTIELWQKDVVTSADGGTSATWTETLSQRIGAQAIQLRSSTGVPLLVRDSGSANLDNTSAGQITMPVLTAAKTNEIFLALVTQVNQSGAPSAATPPSGMTLLSGTSADHRLSTAYQSRDASESNTGFMNVLDSSNDGIAAITAAITEGMEDTLSDGVGMADVDGPTVVYGIVLDIGVAIQDIMADIYFDTVSDGIGLSEVMDAIKPVQAAAADTIGMSEAIVVGLIYSVTVAQTFRTIYNLLDVKAQGASVAETVGVEPALATHYTAGAAVNEVIAMFLSQTPSMVLERTLADVVRVATEISAAYGRTVSETIGIEPDVSLVRAVEVLEAMGIAPSMVAAGIFSASFTDGIRFNDTLVRFLAADLTDSVGVDASVLYKYLVTQSLADTIGVAPTTAYTLFVRADVTDGVGVEPVDLASMLYHAQANEGIRLSAAHVAPNGNTTTWVINAETAAVTEYQNYDFNSFARMGNKYLGANADGVYELNGDTDAGDDIIATLAGGFMQFAGVHLASIKAVYLGIRGTGEFFFKIQDAKGTETVYSARTNAMQTSKVWIGKGLRTRYWAFELVSTGQDFDLESIEFVPLVNKRRV